MGGRGRGRTESDNGEGREGRGAQNIILHCVGDQIDSKSLLFRQAVRTLVCSRYSALRVQTTWHWQGWGQNLSSSEFAHSFVPLDASSSDRPGSSTDSAHVASLTPLFLSLSSLRIQLGRFPFLPSLFSSFLPSPLVQRIKGCGKLSLGRHEVHAAPSGKVEAIRYTTICPPSLCVATFLDKKSPKASNRTRSYEVRGEGAQCASQAIIMRVVPLHYRK